MQFPEWSALRDEGYALGPCPGGDRRRQRPCRARGRDPAAYARRPVRPYRGTEEALTLKGTFPQLSRAWCWSPRRSRSQRAPPRWPTSPSWASSRPFSGRRRPVPPSAGSWSWPPTGCWPGPRRPRPRIRKHVWQQVEAADGFPRIQVAGKALTGWLVIDMDATLVTAYSPALDTFLIRNLAFC